MAGGGEAPATARPGVSLEQAWVGKLKRRYGESVPVERVSAVALAVVRSLAPRPQRDPLVQAELEALAKFIYKAKREVLAARPHDITAKHIPIASDELGAVVAHLEEATGTILDACEKIEAAAEEAEDAVAGRLGEATTEIYQACSFQDITGQRITKVVDALQSIEERVNKLIEVLGGPEDEAGQELADEREGDDRLLNGPQLPQGAKSQLDIDALFDAATG